MDGWISCLLAGGWAARLLFVGGSGVRWGGGWDIIDGDGGGRGGIVRVYVYMYVCMYVYRMALWKDGWMDRWIGICMYLLYVYILCSQLRYPLLYIHIYLRAKGRGCR